MNREEQLALTKELILRAKEGKHSEFQFIHCTAEYSVARKILRANKELARGFKRGCKENIKKLLKSIKAGSIDDKMLPTILVIKEMKLCWDYYAKEAEIIKDSMKEYRCYVWYGHIWNTICNVYRPPEDEVDWRTVPTYWPWNK